MPTPKPKLLTKNQKRRRRIWKSLEALLFKPETAGGNQPRSLRRTIGFYLGKR